MKAYVWDEVGCEVAEFDVSLPEGLTVRQMALLLDDDIAQQCEGSESYKKEVTLDGGVAVMKGLFGHDKLVCMYFAPSDSPEDEELARKRAEADLDKYWDEEE